MRLFTVFTAAALAAASVAMVGTASAHHRIAATPASLTTTAPAAPRAFTAATAPATLRAVEVVVDVSEQRMTVMLNGQAARSWPVSTGRRVHWTPTGVFQPSFLSRHHRSSIYNNAPMPFAVFFNGNIAIHGTNQISRLGQRASKGCVRLHPDHAGELFAWVREVGRNATTIRVVD